MIEAFLKLLMRIRAFFERKKVESLTKSGPVDIEELFVSIPPSEPAPPLDDDDEADAFEKGFK